MQRDVHSASTVPCLNRTSDLECSHEAHDHEETADEVDVGSALIIHIVQRIDDELIGLTLYVSLICNYSIYVVVNRSELFSFRENM